jgi:DNA-directed RNA polymerase subunit L
MQVKVLKKNKNELEIEIEGEGHTFCNVIQNALFKDKRVDFAGYNIAHPLTANPIIYVRTKTGTKPEAVLLNAVKEVMNDVKTLRTVFDKSLQKWEAKQKTL